MMNCRTMWAAGGLLLLAGVSVVFLKPAQAPVAGQAREDDDSLTEAQRKALLARIRNTVRERATLETADMLEIRSRLDRESTILFVVRDGTSVKKGDVLLRFDDAKLKDELAIETINVAKLTAALQKAEQTLTGRKDGRTASISAGSLAVRAAELGKNEYLAKDGAYALKLKAAVAAVAIAEKRFSAAKTVVNHLKATSRTPDERAKAEAELVAAEQAVELAKAAKTLLTQHTLKRRTAELEAAIAKNSADAIQSRTDATVSLSMADGELQSRKAELQVARSRLARVNRQLKLCTIIAPRDGLAMHSLERSRREITGPIEAGAAVRPRQVLLLMPDLTRLQVRARIHESRAHRVEKGQAVSLRFDGIPDTVFHGQVKSLSRFPKQGEWPNTDLMLYDAIISIDKPSPRLRIGMSAVAEIKVSDDK